MKAYAEEYTSNNDQMFSNATNDGGADSLGQLKAGVALNQGALNVDVINWNVFWGKVYKKVFEIIRERLVDSIWVEGEEITPEDFDFPAEVVSNGGMEYTNEQMMLQKAMNRIAMVGQFMQAGIANQEDYYNAANDWLEKDGENVPEKYITDPKEIMESQLAQMQQQLQQSQMIAGQLQEGNIKATKELARTKKADLKGKIKNMVEVENEFKSLTGEQNANA
jgi:hypothetical protein